MMTDVWTVLWKEWHELLRLGGGRRGTILRAVFSVGLLGVIWPWLIGAPFVSSGLPVLFASATSAMYVSALVPDAFGPSALQIELDHTAIVDLEPAWEFALLLGEDPEECAEELLPRRILFVPPLYCRSVRRSIDRPQHEGDIRRDRPERRCRSYGALALAELERLPADLEQELDVRQRQIGAALWIREHVQDLGHRHPLHLAHIQ